MPTEKKRVRSPGHIVLGPKGRLQCMNCGGSYDPFASAGGHGIELGMLAGISKTFTSQHAGCRPTGKARCWACLEEGHELQDHVRLRVLTAAAWPGCGDDGLSSRVIWCHMRGVHPATRDIPVDPSATGWRERMPEMAEHGTCWLRMAKHWEEMEWLFEKEYPTGEAPRLYALMQAIRGEQ